MKAQVKLSTLQMAPRSLILSGDYDMTRDVHNDTYPAIDSAKLNLEGKAVFISGG